MTVECIDQELTQFGETSGLNSDRLAHFEAYMPAGKKFHTLPVADGLEARVRIHPSGASVAFLSNTYMCYSVLNFEATHREESLKLISTESCGMAGRMGRTFPVKTPVLDQFIYTFALYRDSSNVAYDQPIQEALLCIWEQVRKLRAQEEPVVAANS